MYADKSVPQPDTMPILENNYCLQIVETGFAEQFSASHRMGPAQICVKISARSAYSETYRMIPLSTRLFSHWSVPLNTLWLKPYRKVEQVEAYGNALKVTKRGGVSVDKS